MPYNFFAIFLLFCVSIFSQPLSVEPKDYAMPIKEAESWVLRFVHPLLLRHSKDPNEIEGLRKRLDAFITLSDKGVICGYPAPFYHPVKRNTVAEMSYFPKLKKPCLILFVPRAMDIQKLETAEKFENYILMAVAHEMIHYEKEKGVTQNGPQPTRLELAKAEATAYGIVILEMIRPMLLRGRKLADIDVLMSNKLRQFKDDINSPLWVTQFLDYDTDKWNPYR